MIGPVGPDRSRKQDDAAKSRDAPLRPDRRVFLLAALLAAAGGTLTLAHPSAEEAHALPAPAVEAAAGGSDAGLSGGPAATEVAVVAGGCFWGVQGIFQHVAGVTSAVSGYPGGAETTARYAVVGTGTTGHAEAVRVTFDPKVISYGRILQILFSVAHDPTQLNRQGPDHGPQYRSAIFPANPEQARIAKAYSAQLDQTKIFPSPIVTTIGPYLR